MPKIILKNLISDDNPKITVWLKTKVAQKYPQVQKDGFKDLERGLLILKISKDEFKDHWLTAEDINSLLIEVFSLPSKPIGITRAFAKAGGKDRSNKPIIICKKDNVAYYKLANPGEVLLNSVLGEGLLQVFYVKADSHAQAYESVKDLIKKLKGKEVNVVDPYYGVSSLRVVEEIVRVGKSVKFLSCQTNETSSTIQRELGYLRKHYPGRIEFKIYPKKELHDRYILAANSFVIIGQGIKDLGNKESFILVIDDAVGRDIRRELEKSFWRRWGDPSASVL